MRKSAFLSTVLMLLAGSAWSSENGLAFIAGVWKGGSGGAVIEETWSMPQSGRMIGMFRLTERGEPRFYEFMSIEPDGNGWVMYLRHFDPGLHAWEEPEGALVFDLVNAAETRAVFKQRDAETELVYELDESGDLTVTLRKMKDGRWAETPFSYERVD